MSITNYAELQTAIGDYLHRDNLTAIIPDFIALSEAKINRRLRTMAQESTVSGAVAATVALPADFIELISITISTGGSTYPISYKPTSSIDGESSGTYYYSTVGTNIKFQPVDTSATYTLTYYAKFQSLSLGANWLITNAPDVYLYSSLLEAAPYIQNDQRLAVWGSMLGDSIAEIERADRNARYGNNLRMSAA